MKLINGIRATELNPNISNANQNFEELGVNYFPYEIM